MDMGRRALWQWHRVFNSSPSSSACTAQIAIASFWSLLQDLADLSTAPDGWSTVPQNHPFLGYKFPGSSSIYQWISSSADALEAPALP